LYQSLIALHIWRLLNSMQLKQMNFMWVWVYTNNQS